MAEHRKDRTEDRDDAEPVMRLGGRERFPQQVRRSHEDGSRAERRSRGRWRFSSAVEAARHLGNDR